MADNITNITPPRVPFLDARNGQVSREWYRFFLNLFTNTGGGTGVTPIANGGTNSTSAPQAGAVAYGDGQSYRFTTVGTAGQFLTSTGIGAPAWTAISGTAGSVAYGTGPAYAFSAAGTSGDVLISGGAGAPTWTSSPTFTQVTVPTIISDTGITFQTTPTTGGAPITALTIDQYRCQIGNSATVTDGPTGSYSSAINQYYPFATYIDVQSPASAVNAIIIGNYYQGGVVDSTNATVTYDRSINFYCSGIWAGTGNVTISYQMAFQSDVGDSEFSGVLYIGAGNNPSGFAGVRCAIGPLGYGLNSSGLGPGGSVTQATNKSTAVTLDNSCGVITMNAAALAAGASVSFILNNVFIATTDTLIVNMGPAGTADTYSCTAQITGAGTARIRVTNYSATSRSEAAKINFAIITATTS